MEILVEYPKEHTEIPKVIETIMQDAAWEFYQTLPIPAEGSPSGHWVH